MKLLTKTTYFVLLLLCIPSLLRSQVQFTDVGEESGITYRGKSYGSSWGDVDGNGFLDLFTSNHSNLGDLYFDNDTPMVYYNYETVFLREDLMGDITETDWHGGAFFDVDWDGDLDLITMLGGSSANVFFENDGGIAPIDLAAEFNVRNNSASGRTPGLLDLNNDGFLDLILNGVEEVGGPFVPQLMLNDQGSIFNEAEEDVNFDWSTSVFSTCADFDGDGSLHVISLNSRPTIYRVENNVFEYDTVLGSGRVYDFLVEDLNGDLLTDLFTVKGDRGIYIEEFSPSNMRCFYTMNPTTDTVSHVFSSSSDAVIVKMYPRGPSSPYVFILGNDSVVDGLGESIKLELSAFDPDFVGIPAIEDTLTMPHIYIGFDPDSENWKVRVKNGYPETIPFALEIEGSNLDLVEADIPEGIPVGSQMYYNQGGGDFEQDTSPWFDSNNIYMSVVASDFDNDMDMDIYAVSTNYAVNKVNILWENVNNESFIEHPGAWGASGDGPGIGESVTTIDYNNDGFMDLFVGNGASVYWVDSAKANLYENQGNDNNWLKIDLQGTVSNHMGIHSRVIVHAGGVAQLRYQNGGMHRFCQNDPRLHFGLAQNEIVDSVEVFWPSGIRQVLEEVDVNQIITITEDASCLGPLPQVENIVSTVQSNGVLLDWEPSEGSIGCQLRATRLSNNQNFTTIIQNPAPSEFFINQQFLNDGESYSWRIRCACYDTFSGDSTLVFSPWSASDIFVWPANGQEFMPSGGGATTYPNPASTVVFIKLGEIDEGQHEFVIYDLQGREVESSWIPAESHQTIRLDVSSLNPGIYFIRTRNGKFSSTEPLVIE